MTAVLSPLLRMHLMLYAGYVVIIMIVAPVLTFAHVGEIPDGWAVTLRLLGGIPPHYFLAVVAVILAVIHLPVYVAHGITRTRFAAVSALLAILSSAAFALFNTAIWATERLMTFGNPVGVAEAASVAVAHLAFNVLYMACGWLAALVFYRFHPFLATLLLPFALGPVFGAHWAFDDHLMGMVIDRAGTRFSIGVGLVLVAGCIVVAVTGAYAMTRSLPIRTKKA